MADVVQASITIQRAYRRYKKRKEERRKSNKYQAATKLEKKKSKHGMSKSSQVSCRYSLCGFINTISGNPKKTKVNT